MFFFLTPLSYTQAKNLATGAVPTKSALRVLQLQQTLLNSRVIYASATGASDVYQMAYMEKMGLWCAPLSSEPLYMEISYRVGVFFFLTPLLL